MPTCRALVAGASRGLGYYAAEALAEEGCSLAVIARGVKELAQAAEKLRGAGAPRVAYRGLDLASRDVEELVPWALRELGGLEAVVMAYGNISREPLELHEASWSDWVEAARLYLASTGVVIRDLVSMNPVKASLILVSSFSVAEPMPPLVVSDAARAGLSRIARVAARRYPERLRPLLVLVGSFPTPGALATVSRIAEREGRDPRVYWRERVEGLSPLSRGGAFEEWKWLVKTLVKAPEYLHGSVILFDGGSSRVAWP